MNFFCGRKLLLLFLLPSLFSCSGRYLLHSSFEESPVPPAPDYADEKNWASLPWVKNNSDSVPGKQKRPEPDDPAVDVFFIHPTAFTKKPNDQYQWNASVTNQKINRKVDDGTILYQASVFNRSCNIYAPRYRQAQISAFYPRKQPDGKKALDLAYSDVKAAFEYYLQHYNNGKPFIIASHSQGTYHAQKLLCEFLQDSLLSRQLVAAYLIGLPVIADSMSKLPPCTSPDETGCYCSWNTYAKNYFPKYYENGLKYAVCTNPLNWKTDESYSPDSLNLGGVLYNFRKIYPALCDAQIHQGMLWIRKPDVALLKILPVKIYHAGDINLFYFNVQQNVAARIGAYMKANR